MSRWCDRIITGGILFLILFTPFAFGSVHPWAFAIMEALIFLLVAVWMAKNICVSMGRGAGSREPGAESRERGGRSREEGARSRERGGRSTFFVFGRPSSVVRLSSLFVPLTLFLVFCLLQLLPLPPSVLHMLSPQTYEMYTRSLPGWPERMPWSDPALQDPQPEMTAAVILPTAEEVRNGAVVPFSNPSPLAHPPAAPSSQLPAPNSGLPAHGSLVPETWFPLSLAPALTRSDLLKLTAYGALFFLVLLYPFSTQQSAVSPQHSVLSTQSSALLPPSSILDRRSSFPSTQSSSLSPHPSSLLRADGRFYRSVLLVVLFAGLLVAAMGFIQRFSWNGKILWFFVPYDWGAPMAGANPRSSGPFVNPDHFANYLSLIFPLAVAGASFRTSLMRKPLEEGFRVVCAVTAFILFTGILLSLSRSGWISALLGIVILLWLSPWGAEEQEAGSREQGAGSRGQGKFWTAVSRLCSPVRMALGGARIARVSLILVCSLLVVSLLFVGKGGRQQVDRRLGETFTEDAGLWGRANVWKDSLGMIRDFPIFGVGLGSWPELFPRYRRAPWSRDFYREAHNDYLELFTETGLIGFMLLSWFFFQGGKWLLRGAKNASREDRPFAAAIVAGVGVMTFHELVDFSLQIPANAFLFTLLFTLGLRMTWSGEHGASGSQEAGVSGQHSAASSQRSAISSQPSVVSHQGSPFRPAMIGVVALVLAVVSLRQEQIPYPYNLKEPRSIAEAKELFRAHPANAFSQISLLRLREMTAPLPWQLSVSEAALWLEPTNPYLRDLYAAVLLRMGKTSEGLREITRSVLESPSLSTHFYLSGKLMPWLSKDEQQAVEEGFKQALVRSYPGVIENLAGFYAGQGRFAEQGMLFERAAQMESDSQERANLLLKAGLAYIRARNDTKAEMAWRSGIAALPKDPQAYQHLATAIYGPKKDLRRAQAVVAEGIKNGAAPFLLYLSLAEAAHKAERDDAVKAALNSAKGEIEKAARTGEDPYALYLLLADAAARVHNQEKEKSALLAALDLRPRSSTILFRLANLYLQEGKFDPAALYYGKIANINPNSADVYYQLAVAEEGRYHFAAADKAFARALELAPRSDAYRQRYESFRARLEQNQESPNQ